jgi:hypothetical protein
VLYQQTMPQEIVQQLFALAEELSIGMMTYNAQGIVANCHHDEYMELEAFINHMELKHYEKPLEALDGSVNKCLGTAPVAIAPQIEKKFAEHFGGRINVSRSEPFFIELVPLGVDKASSLARLCGILGCTEQDMIACGDGFNDIAMIEFAGLGIAMANAQEPVKAVADYVTRSNEEDGVAYVVERFVLGKGSV